MASEEDRNSRLDTLASSTKDWAKARRDYLQKQADFSKKLLKGRTGAERLNDDSVDSATDLLVEEVGQFLTGQ